MLILKIWFGNFFSFVIFSQQKNCPIKVQTTFGIAQNSDNFETGWRQWWCLRLFLRKVPWTRRTIHDILFMMIILILLTRTKKSPFYGLVWIHSAIIFAVQLNNSFDYFVLATFSGQQLLVSIKYGKIRKCNQPKEF